jgi:transcriptional regulator with XRE-family HTH domain
MTDEMMEKRKLIGSRLSIARERAGLSQSQVAAEMGLPRPSISEIEAGRRRVAAEELARFAEIYSVDIDWLAGAGEQKADSLRDKLQLAARGVASLKNEDLEKVIELLVSLKPEGNR